ncbi:MAG: phosphatidylglycerophosphatase A [Gammaproteobacteria bacterium]|jgi:phosphatidylglycerophosphatase A|nr:phosphatidylglycerophosphatase A [Gammaproteobacteria bacterium]
MNKLIPAHTVFSSPVHFLAFGFGSGLAPWAPGTAGTLVAVFLEWPLRSQGLEVRLLVAVLLFASGVWICGESSRRLGVHDHGGIVWDEIAGYFLTMLLAPSGWLWSVLGFVLFRLFDIFKPWPIREIDHRLGGGLGIMVDDTVAGVFAGLILWGLVQLHLFT